MRCIWWNINLEFIDLANRWWDITEIDSVRAHCMAGRTKLMCEMHRSRHLVTIWRLRLIGAKFMCRLIIYWLQMKWKVAIWYATELCKCRDFLSLFFLASCKTFFTYFYNSFPLPTLVHNTTDGAIRMVITKLDRHEIQPPLHGCWWGVPNPMPDLITPALVFEFQYRASNWLRVFLALRRYFVLTPCYFRPRYIGQLHDTKPFHRCVFQTDCSKDGDGRKTVEIIHS